MVTRLDQLLVSHGLAPTRSRARDLILRGLVRVGGETVTKAGELVVEDAELCVAGEHASYVSRGAEKLMAALRAFGFDPKDRVALDVGASTGGFTEVLLAAGARRVYAVDVGYGQLHERLRADPRVVSLERRDARTLTANEVPEPVGAVAADVSFISLAKVLPAVLALTAPGSWLVALVKPQFEAGREAVGKGGIVRDAAARERAASDVSDWIAARAGWRVVGIAPSPITGGSGNLEYLLGAVRDD